MRQLLHYQLEKKQRVEIVRILLQDPQILIMDEPTSVLTPQEVESLFVTKCFSQRRKNNIIYTHKLEEVISICDTVTIMRNGEVMILLQHLILQQNLSN